MKIIKMAILLFAVSTISFDTAGADSDIMRAMRDEISRSMKELKLENLQRPYFIDYTLRVMDSKSIKADLGSITESDDKKIVTLTVGIRVGNYKFDNTNFFDIGLSFFGSSDDEERYKGRQMPVEMDYNSLRRELWLATDAAYKQAAELYTKKESTIKNLMRKDTTSDFLAVGPLKSIDTVPFPAFDRTKFEDWMRRLSVILKNYPEIYATSCGVEYQPATVYYVNSEGMEYVRTDMFAGIEIVAHTQSDDGMPCSDFFSAYAKDPNDLPGLDSLKRGVQALAERMKAGRAASTLDEPYSGPVLFEGQAAAEAFAQVFVPNLVAQRSPITENGMQDNDRYNAFQTKIGGRVLPEFLSVTDSPSMKNYDNTKLTGYYNIDDDGIMAKDVQVVSDGFLKSLLSSRVPNKRMRETNGHRRGGSPMFSNVELTGKGDKVMDSKGLKNMMMKLCKDRELPFGIIVRRAMNQNVLFTSLYRVSYGGVDFQRGNGKLGLIEVVKLYPDGSEELVRGVEGAGFIVQAFKDIIGVSKEKYAYNFLAPSVWSSFIYGGDSFVASSVIVPDILFEDAEIRTPEADYKKPPFLPNPVSMK